MNATDSEDIFMPPVCGDGKRVPFSNSSLSVTDTTPRGRTFTIRDNGETRTLEWHPWNGLGSTTVPLKRNRHTAKLFAELRTVEGISERTGLLCFAC